MKEIELIDKRKPREKHFLQEDGTIVAKIYDSDIHYNKNGRYEEIDNTLVKENGHYHNKSNGYKAFFSESDINNLMEMRRDDFFLKISLKDEKNKKKKKLNPHSNKNNCILYEDIMDGISLEYITLPEKVKETIIFQKNIYNKINFIVNTNLELTEHDSIIYARNNEKTIFIIEKPYMKDSKGEINNNISYKLTKKEKYYELELILDKDWLKLETTQFPIYIDPTVSNNSDEILLYDTYIYPGDTNQNKNEKSYLKAGVERTNGVDTVNRTLIKFTLPEIGTGSEIISADLYIIPYIKESDEPAVHLMEAHQVTADWNEETAIWDNMHDKFNPKVESISEFERSSFFNFNIMYRTLAFDVTNLVKKWYMNEPNYGVMIKSCDERYIDDDYPMFFSKSNQVNGDPKPVIYISYRNQNGIENYLDYKKQDFAEGQTYVNTYNGNMTAIFNLGSTIGEKYSAKVNLIYNTDDVVVNNQTIFGKGYKLNVNQTIKENNEISENNYLEYLDEDGTKHYFGQKEEGANIYYDEDGMGLQIEKNESICILKDKQENTMHFTKNNVSGIYYLTEIRKDNNITDIEYNSENQITKIKDTYDGEINFLYNDNMIEINSPVDNVKLNYLDNKLISIITKNGTTNIDYNNNNLISSITDITGLKVEYEYYQNSPYKMKKILHYGLNNTLGKTLTLEYGSETTTIVDNKGRVENIVFNSNGNVITRNNIKSYDDINEASSTSLEYGFYTEDKNKILCSSIPVTHIRNYLKNTSFEEERENFTVEEDSHITIGYTTEYSHFGNRSLKVCSNLAGQSTEQRISVPKGSYYTFSGYFKADSPFELSLSYGDKEGRNVFVNQEIGYTEDFERHDITIYYDEEATTDLIIRVSFPAIGIIYIDDIQLEQGEVANLYNMIDNSDFSEGLSEWNLSAYEGNEVTPDLTKYFNLIKFNNGKNTALKVSMSPLNGTGFNKKFPIKGKAGDLYTVSFWYKNTGVSACRPYAGNYVMINFKPTDGEAEYCAVSSPSFNSNENIWQYYTYRNFALEDYDEVDLRFVQDTEANEFYITNLSFYKEITSGDYQYDDSGNLVGIINQSDEKTEFTYDINNQLVKAENANGQNVKYEYDNVKKDRVLKSFSQNGLVNEFEYDSYGNVIKTKISNKYVDEIQPGEYKIRSKGTNKYIKAELNMVLLESSQCSNTIWKIEKNEDKIKFAYATLPEYYITHNSNSVFLSKSLQNNEFILENNDNGSFHIIWYDSEGNKKYLKATESILSLEEFELGNSAFEFYIELIEELFIEKTKTYSNDGRFITSVTDSNFNITNYEFDELIGMISAVIDPKGNRVSYNYNDKNELQSIMYGDKSVAYAYNDKKLLSKITQGNKNYNFEYDNFMKVSKVSIGNDIVLVTNEYESNDGSISSKTYGNNQQISYEYDDFDRINKITTMDNNYNYRYDNNGNIAKVISNQNTEKYYYDISNRLYRYNIDNFSLKYTYDSCNNIQKKEYKLNFLTNNVINNYNNKSQVIKTNLNNQQIDYEYDSLSRLVKKYINSSYQMEYEYVTNGKRTTNLIRSIKNGENKYIYSYDALNNITTVRNETGIIKQYYYNSYNMLEKENDFERNLSTEYIYDSSGNMTSEIIKDINSQEIITTNNYQYENINWEDQLTKYNETNITYDQIGNMLTFGNNISLTWINGRTLNTYGNSEKNLTVSYKYNVDGIRTSKTINNIETKYYLEGDSIIFEETNNKKIYYLYDITGIVGMEYENNIYYYLKNIQGDIIGILNSNYEQIVEYKYDSWGNLLDIIDGDGNVIVDINNIAHINPFRYRGYYYDKETELYYLNSRYYNPKIKRFISADNYISTDTGLLGHNMYIYANNNPIVYTDYNGEFIHVGVVIGLAILGGVAGAAIYANSKKQNAKAKKEIEKAQKKKKETKKNKTATKKYEQTLKNNAKTVKKETKNMNPIQKLDYFVENVKTGGQYDLKNTGDWEEDVYYDGKVMESQDLGNYHFGYIGRALGYDVEFLTFGAGLYQVKSGTSKLAYCFTPSFCDDPRDSYYIRLGAMAYDEDNR